MTSTHTNNVGIIQLHQNDVPSKLKLILHHRFPNVELISPVYIGNVAPYYPLPGQRVDVDSTMQTGFNIELGQRSSFGALIYKMQRKSIAQFNENAMSNEEATYIYLVIIWKVNKYGEFRVVSDLIGHDRSYVWDKDGLMKLADRCRMLNTPHTSIEETWLMHDHRVFMTRVNVTCEEEYYKLEMTISEGSVQDDTRRIRYIDVDR
jgi:hypothetical protein